MKTLRVALLIVVIGASGLLASPAADAAPTPPVPATCAGVSPGVTECRFTFYGLDTTSGSAVGAGSVAYVTIHTADGRTLPLRHFSGQGAGVYTSTTTFDARHIPWGTTLTCRVHGATALAAQFACA